MNANIENVTVLASVEVTGEPLPEEMGSFSETEAQVMKEPLLGNPVVVGGVSFGVLCMGLVFGYVLAKRKLKKEKQNY